MDIEEFFRQGYYRTCSAVSLLDSFQYYDDVPAFYERIIQIVYIITGFLTLILALLIMRNKKRYHPSELIAFHCFFCSCFILNNMGLHMICEFNLTYVGAWTQPRSIVKVFTDPEWLDDHKWNDRLKFLR